MAVIGCVSGSSERQQGYTVIEVTLFLAISGLLFLVAIFATGNTIRNFRFTDSGNSLEAYVQKQYDNVLNGVNPRDNTVTCTNSVVSAGSQTPGTSNCLFMGKLILFEQGDYRLTSYDIVGTEPANVNFNQTDEQLIASYQPKIVTTVGTEDYSIPWQAYISGVRRVSSADASPVAANALAIIRSPVSSRIVSYTYKEPSATPVIDVTAVVNNSALNANKVTNYCITSADLATSRAKLVITGTTSNQNAAQVVFDQVTAGDCDGA